jgi:phosphonate transport system substrate-binding protein
MPPWLHVPLHRLACAILVVGGFAAAEASPERTVGVVPQYSPLATAEHWQPLLTRLARDTGLTLHFTTATSVSQYEARLLEGRYDFAYSNPLHYRDAARAAGYRALARDTQPLIGILVARADAADSLAALRDATLAFPSPRALGATLMVRHDLRRLGVPHEIAYLGTHESVYQAVRRGRYLAGGGVRRTFELLPAGERAELQILHETEPTASHVFAVHPRVPAPEAARMQRALARLHADSEGRALLETLGLNQLVTAREADFAPLARLPTPPRATPITVHVPPQSDDDGARRALQVVVAVLRQRLERNAQLQVHTDAADFERAIAAERGPALVSADPLRALRLIARGYEVIAQRTAASTQVSTHTEVPATGRKTLIAGSGASTAPAHSLLVVRSDSPLRRLADLRGRRIALGAGPDEFLTATLPRAMLAHAGLTGAYVEVRPEPASPGGALEMLARGGADAVALGGETAATGAVRIIADSGPLPGPAWLIGPRPRPELRDELRGLLLGLGPDTPAYGALREAGRGPLAPADNAAYVPLARYLAEARQ